MPKQERQSGHFDPELGKFIEDLASREPEWVAKTQEYLDKHCARREPDEVDRAQKAVAEFIELLGASPDEGRLAWLLELAQWQANAICAKNVLARYSPIIVIQGDNVTNKTEISVGSATGTTIIGIARKTTSYNKYVDESQHLDGELKDSLKRAREEIDKLGLPKEEEEDLADDLGKLTDELGKENPSENRVQKLLKRIEAVASTVAAIVKPLAIIKELF